MVVSGYLLLPSLILLASGHSRGTRYPTHVSFVTTPQGGQCPKNTCCMKSQSHERLWPILLKLKFGNGWLTSNCLGSSCKKFKSGFQFQFQFQFQGFQFQFHFQFYQFQFQFQFRNWNWNWAAIPVPELNLPQPCFGLLNWTLPTTPDHPDSTSIRPGSFELGRTTSCSRSLRGPYRNGTPCQPIPSVLTLLPTLRVNSLPIPLLVPCGTSKLSYRSQYPDLLPTNHQI